MRLITLKANEILMENAAAGVCNVNLKRNFTFSNCTDQIDGHFMSISISNSCNRKSIESVCDCDRDEIKTCTPTQKLRRI